MQRLSIPSSGQLLVHDTFSGTDGEFLNGRLPDTVKLQGTQWIKDNNYDLEIGSNKLTYTLCAPENDDIFKENDHYIEVGKNNVSIECDLKILDATKSANHAVLLRYHSQTAHIAVMWQSVAGAASSLTIRKQYTTGDTVGVSDDLDAHIFSAGELSSYLFTEQTLRIVDDGVTVTGELVGTGISVSATNSDYINSTRVGVKTNDYNDQTWDNFKVWKS